MGSFDPCLEQTGLAVGADTMNAADALVIAGDELGGFGTVRTLYEGKFMIKQNPMLAVTFVRLVPRGTGPRVVKTMSETTPPAMHYSFAPGQPKPVCIAPLLTEGEVEKGPVSYFAIGRGDCCDTPAWCGHAPTGGTLDAITDNDNTGDLIRAVVQWKVKYAAKAIDRPLFVRVVDDASGE